MRAGQETTETLAYGQEYLSCPWIEGGLVFGRGLFHVCCIAHHTNGGWMPISPFSDSVLPPIEDVLRVRAELRRANQGGVHERCKGCINLRKQRWKSRFMFHTLNFSHFTRCNLKCNYCYVQREARNAVSEGRVSVLAVLRAMIQQELLSPDAVVHWGGGEPTLLEEFDELLTLLSAHGCTSMVNTNGTIYSMALCDALRRGTAFVTCSIDAGTPATYAALKGRDCFEQAFSHLVTGNCGGSVLRESHRAFGRGDSDVGVRVVYGTGETSDRVRTRVRKRRKAFRCVSPNCCVFVAPQQSSDPGLVRRSGEVLSQTRCRCTAFCGGCE